MSSRRKNRRISDEHIAAFLDWQGMDEVPGDPASAPDDDAELWFITGEGRINRDFPVVQDGLSLGLSFAGASRSIAGALLLLHRDINGPDIRWFHSRRNDTYWLGVGASGELYHLTRGPLDAA